MPVRARYTREPGGPNPFASDQIADGALVVEGGKDRRIGPCGGDVREDTLRAAALVEVIVD